MTELRELVVLSLEPWDEVRRRNQLLVEALVAEHAELRVLFVEPPIAALRTFRGRVPRSSLRPVRGLERVHVLRLVEWVPDRLSPYVRPLSGRDIRHAARTLAFESPTLWINNHSLARFALRTRWPVVYDITDDWLLTNMRPGKLRRAKTDDSNLMRHAEAITVCSPALAGSRGTRREVHLIPNGIDVAHFTTPQLRPDDLGEAPVAVYVGTLHDERLDVALAIRIARDLPEVRFVYVGPDCLREESRRALTRNPNVRLLGQRPYDRVPAYLQHADVIVVPHVVSPFTESLDPIKARECVAVRTPTVATPVAGFRDLGAAIRIASAHDFTRELIVALREGDRARPPGSTWTWDDAGRAFASVLESSIQPPRTRRSHA